jgi:sensor domain CHASE-containing protein
MTWLDTAAQLLEAALLLGAVILVLAAISLLRSWNRRSEQRIRNDAAEHVRQIRLLDAETARSRAVERLAKASALDLEQGDEWRRER